MDLICDVAKRIARNWKRGGGEDENNEPKICIKNKPYAYLCNMLCINSYNEVIKSDFSCIEWFLFGEGKTSSFRWKHTVNYTYIPICLLRKTVRTIDSIFFKHYLKACFIALKLSFQTSGCGGTLTCKNPKRFSGGACGR